MSRPALPCPAGSGREAARLPLRFPGGGLDPWELTVLNAFLGPPALSGTGLRPQALAPTLKEREAGFRLRRTLCARH